MEVRRRRKWAISLVLRRGLKRTNDQERSNGFQGAVIGEGGPRATEGMTGGCRKGSLTMTNAQHIIDKAETSRSIHRACSVDREPYTGIMTGNGVDDLTNL